MKSINPIAWWRRRADQRQSQDAFGAAEEELYALLDEASKVSAT
jgi:hypothetical protein